MRPSPQPPSRQQRAALRAHHGLGYMRIDLVSVGIVVQKQHRRHERRDEGKHGPVGGIAKGVDVVHNPADEEGLMRREEPHPQHEQYARYAVDGTDVGQIPELVVVSDHDELLVLCDGPRKCMLSPTMNDQLSCCFAYRTEW